MKQSMRKKIQSSMILVIALTLIIAYAITTLVVYRQTIHIMEGEVRQEADYINVAKIGRASCRERVSSPV